jgi:quercetin dioxygenase-like cupin family protein
MKTPMNTLPSDGAIARRVDYPTNSPSSNPTRAMGWIWCGVLSALLLPGHALAPEPEPVDVEVLAQTTVSWDGTPLPRYPRAQPEITILRIVIPAHTQLPLHKHPVINAGVLLKGELTVVAEDGRTLHLEAGDSIVELVNLWHYGRNDGDEPAEIIVFYAGIPGKPITITRPGP